jgi:hypothetical protein
MLWAGWRPLLDDDELEELVCEREEEEEEEEEPPRELLCSSGALSELLESLSESEEEESEEELASTRNPAGRLPLFFALIRPGIAKKEPQGLYVRKRECVRALESFPATRSMEVSQHLSLHWWKTLV